MTLGFVTFVDVALLNQQTLLEWISRSIWFVGLITPHRHVSGLRRGSGCEITKPTNDLHVDFAAGLVHWLSNPTDDHLRGSITSLVSEISKPTNETGMVFATAMVYWLSNPTDDRRMGLRGIFGRWDLCCLCNNSLLLLNDQDSLIY